MNKKLSFLDLRIRWSEFLQIYIYSLAVSGIFIYATMERHKYDNLNGVLQNLNTYFSVSVNALIVLIIGIYIGFTNYILDKTFPWLEKGAIRMALQVFFGGIVSSIVTSRLAYIYFLKMPTLKYSANEYFGIMFPVAMVLIVAANIYFWYAGPTLQVFYQKIRQPKHYNESTAINDLQNDGNTQTFKLPCNVLIIYAMNNMIYYVTEDLTTRYLPLSLVKIMSEIDHNDYFRINRKCILHRKVIERIRKVPNTRRWEVIVKPVFVHWIKVELGITRNLVKSAVNWFNNTHVE